MIPDRDEVIVFLCGLHLRGRLVLCQQMHRASSIRMVTCLPFGMVMRNGPFLGTDPCGGNLPTMSTYLVRALRAQAASRAVRHTLTRTPHAAELAHWSGTPYLRAKSCTHQPAFRASAFAPRTFATAVDPAQDRAAQAQLRRTPPTHSRSCSAIQAVPCVTRCCRVHR